jgi:hypothetical protein
LVIDNTKIINKLMDLAREEWVIFQLGITIIGANPIAPTIGVDVGIEPHLSFSPLPLPIVGDLGKLLIKKKEYGKGRIRNS